MNNLTQWTNNAVMVLMVSATNHSLGISGATLSCSISKDGGAFSSISPVVIDRGLGWYSVGLTAIDCNTIGELVLHVEASGCDPTDRVLEVVGTNRAIKLLA